MNEQYVPKVSDQLLGTPGEPVEFMSQKELENRDDYKKFKFDAKGGDASLLHLAS